MNKYYIVAHHNHNIIITTLLTAKVDDHNKYKNILSDDFFPISNHNNGETTKTYSKHFFGFASERSQSLALYPRNNSPNCPNSNIIL